jgi:tetratricopeptide (TPR) repeat protein
MKRFEMSILFSVLASIVLIVVGCAEMSAASYFNRGFAYSKKGQYDQAISDYNKALEINPRNHDANNGLAWLLATCPNARYRNGAKAVELAKKAVELNPEAIYLDTLAATYAEVGKFEDAITTQEKAIAQLRKECDIKNLINKFIERLNSYKDHKPWREK